MLVTEPKLDGAESEEELVFICSSLSIFPELEPFSKLALRRLILLRFSWMGVGFGLVEGPREEIFDRLTVTASFRWDFVDFRFSFGSPKAMTN